MRHCIWKYFLKETIICGIKLLSFHWTPISDLQLELPLRKGKGCTERPWPHDLDLIQCPTCIHLLIKGSYPIFTDIPTWKPLQNHLHSVLTKSMLIYQSGWPHPLTQNDLITSHIICHPWMLKGIMWNLTLWPWPNLVAYFYTSACKRQFTNIMSMQWIMLFSKILQL